MQSRADERSLACPTKETDFSFLICSPFLTAVTTAVAARAGGLVISLALVVCNIVVTHCATDTSLISELCPTTAARTKWEGRARPNERTEKGEERRGRREEEEEGEHDSLQESTSND